MIFFKRKRKLKILKNFLENLKRPCFTQEYIEKKKNKIDALRWLVAFYENRAASTPEEMLDILIDRYSFDDIEKSKSDIDWIVILHFWIKNNTIAGF